MTQLSENKGEFGKKALKLFCIFALAMSAALYYASAFVFKGADTQDISTFVNALAGVSSAIGFCTAAGIDLTDEQKARPLSYGILIAGAALGLVSAWRIYFVLPSVLVS